MKNLLAFLVGSWRSIVYLLFSVYLFTHNFHGGGGPKIPHFDKFVHFCLFVGLIFIALYDFARARPWLKKWIISVILFYGISIEVFQALFLPYRSGNLMDIVADTVGVIVGVILYSLYKNSRLYRPAVKRNV